MNLLVSMMREKAISGMMAATRRGGTSVEDTIRQKSVSDIAVQTTTETTTTTVQTTIEEGLVPLPVSDDNNCLLTFNLWLLLQTGWEARIAPNRCVFYVDHSKYLMLFHV